MKKYLLLDADGVTIPASTYFSTRYANEFGIPVEILLPFFKNEFLECQIGKKDLKEVLGKYLQSWQWNKSIDDLLQYWFEDGAMPVADIMAVVKMARDEGTQTYLATDQEKYRAEYLWNTLVLCKHFDGSLFSHVIGSCKNDPVYWTRVLQLLGNPDPSEVEFWDDDEKVVAVAKNAGIDAHFFTTAEEFKRLVLVSCNHIK